MDIVISGTPIDLAGLVHVPQRILRARYEFADAGTPTLGSIVNAALDDVRRNARARRDDA